MKTVYSLIILLLIHLNSYADHTLGGELYYTHLFGEQYKITMTVYGDCSGGAFSHLKGAEPHINILNELGDFKLLILHEDESQRKEVSNVCPAEEANTTCKSPTGTVPGVVKFVYTANTSLPPAAKWQLLFAGEMDNSGKQQSGFTFQLGNVTNNSGFGFYMYLEATLNNLHSHNSSPEFTTLLTPYYCINMPQQYNPGAIDTDNDDLKFKLTKPIDLNGIVTKYVNPYSPRYPFSTISGNVFHNESDGQIAFTPSKQEVSLVVHKAEEYRNGAMVGSCMRVMSFFMRSGCNNSAPYGDIDPQSVSGGIQYQNTINVCKGDGIVEFSIPVKDNNADKIHVRLSNIPSGANIQVNGNDTKEPVINFSWDISQVEARNYTFFANYNDGACPMPGNQVIAYDINIAYPITVFHKVLAPTNCKFKQHVGFYLDGGVLPRKLVITNSSGDTVANYQDYTGTIEDSFEVGLYKITSFADYLPCSTTYNFEVTDYGIYPDPPGVPDKDVCLHDPVADMQPVPTAGSKVQWYELNGVKLEYIPTYSTDEVFHYKWLVNQKVKVCESIFDTVHIRVHPNPIVNIQNEGGHACYADAIYLIAKGAETYKWEPENKIELIEGKPLVSIREPEEFTVTGYSTYGCKGFDTVAYNNIEQCCTFSYPTAFTPNNDGLNDGWNPITYGNVDFYLLSIYNRWGERIFISSDPHKKWDGTYRGLPADIGTYHFKFKANCIVGGKEEEAGSFLLLR